MRALADQLFGEREVEFATISELEFKAPERVHQLDPGLAHLAMRWGRIECGASAFSIQQQRGYGCLQVTVFARVRKSGIHAGAESGDRNLHVSR